MPSILSQAQGPDDDIKGIIVLEPDPGILPLVIWLAVVAGILLLVALLVWLIFRFGKRKEPKLSPEVAARRRLHRIEAEKTTLAPNEMALEISDALKDYLQERYKDPLRFETAQEFLARYVQPDQFLLPAPVHQDLRSFVIMSEEVKFGNPPDAERKIRHLFQLAHNVIKLSEVSHPQPKSDDLLLT